MGEDKGPSSGAHLPSPCSISMRYLLIDVCKGVLVSQCWVLCLMDDSLCSSVSHSHFELALSFSREREAEEKQQKERKDGCSE